MIHVMPELYKYEEPQRSQILLVLYVDNYCQCGQVMVQPVKKLFWKIYTNDGKPYKSFAGLFVRANI